VPFTLLYLFGEHRLDNSMRAWSAMVLLPIGALLLGLLLRPKAPPANADTAAPQRLVGAPV
jgi:hypothetical protein